MTEDHQHVTLALLLTGQTRMQTVLNGGANTLQVFPDTGQELDEEGANNAITLAVGERAIFLQVNDAQWISLVGVAA